MIGLNTYKLPITPRRQQQKPNVAKHNVNQNNSFPTQQLPRLSFGIAIVENNWNYVPNMSNRAYTNKNELDSFIVGDNIDASTVDIMARKHIEAKNNLKAKSLEANDYINIGSNAHIKGNVTAKTSHIKAGENIKANSLHANTNVMVGKNAQINDGIVAENGEITAKDGLCTVYLYAGGNVKLGSVNKLLDIFFNDNSKKNEALERVLILESDDINRKNDKKINVHLSDNINILTIKSASGDPEILKKFAFKTSAKPTFIRLVGDNPENDKMFII